MLSKLGGVCRPNSFVGKRTKSLNAGELAKADPFQTQIKANRAVKTIVKAILKVRGGSYLSHLLLFDFDSFRFVHNFEGHQSKQF